MSFYLGTGMEFSFTKSSNLSPSSSKLSAVKWVHLGSVWLAHEKVSRFTSKKLWISQTTLGISDAKKGGCNVM